MKKPFLFKKKEIRQNPYKTTAFTYISKNYPEKEKDLGKLVILFSSEKSSDNNKLEKLLVELENIYYETPINENEHISSKRLENIFELSLKKFNQEFTWLAQTKNININFKKVNILIAVVRNDDLLFSQVNEMDIFLTYEGKTGENKIINIAEPANSRTALPSAMKLLANLISGDLTTTETLLITNKNLSKYLSLYKIKNLLLLDDAKLTNQELKKNLKQVTNTENFAWILIKRGEEDNEEILNQVQDDKKGEEEYKTRKDKKNNATIKQYISNKLLVFQNKLRKTNEKQSVSKTIFDETIEVNFGSKMKKLLTVLPFYKSDVNTKQFALPWHKKLKNLIRDIITYPWFIRFGLVIILMLIISFSYSAFYLADKQEQEIIDQAYSTMILDLNSELTNARSKLIYGDKIGTEEIYKSLKEKVADLDDDTELHEKDKSKLEDGLNGLYYDIYNIQKLENLNPQVDYESYLVNNIKYEKIELSENDIIPFAGNTKTLLETDINSWRTNLVENTSEAIKKLTLSTILEDYNNKVYFWTEDSAIWEWDRNANTLEDLEVLSTEDIDPIAVTSYGKNLYFLDKEKNQIYKFTKTTAGFSKGKVWIMDADLPNVSSAVDMAIDSNIYILYKDGIVDKYFSGNKEASFSLNSIEPKVESVNEIITNETIDSIYIVSYDEKRILVLNKDGVFQKQYYIDLNSEIDDVLIEKNKIYILSENKIYQAGI